MGNAVTPNGSGITDAERTALEALTEDAAALAALADDQAELAVLADAGVTGGATGVLVRASEVGTIAPQNANAVAITGGTITGATVGGITPAQQDLVANGDKATVTLATVAPPYAGTETLVGVPGMATKTVTEMGGASAIAAYVTANSSCDCTLSGTTLTLTAKAYGDDLNETEISGTLLLATGKMVGGTGPVVHAALPCVQTFQFGAKAAYLDGDDWLDLASNLWFEYVVTPSFSVSHIEVDISGCTDAQSVALVFQAVYNAQPTAKYVAGTPVAGLITFTAKDVGPDANAYLKEGSTPTLSTMSQSGRNHLGSRVAALEYQQESLVWAATGDSITAASDNYVDLACAKLGRAAPRDYGVTSNWAVSGTTVMYKAGLSELSNSLNGIVASWGYTPNVITIMCGVNDCGQDQPLGDPVAVMEMAAGSLATNVSFAEAFRKCLEIILAGSPTARVVVILPLDSTATGSGGTLQQYREIEEYICYAMRVSRGLNVEVWDPRNDLAMWATDTTYFSDGTHPTAAGHAVLGDYVARKLLQHETRDVPVLRATKGGAAAQTWDLALPFTLQPDSKRAFRLKMRMTNPVAGANKLALRVNGSSANLCRTGQWGEGAAVGSVIGIFDGLSELAYATTYNKQNGRCELCLDCPNPQSGSEQIFHVWFRHVETVGSDYMAASNLIISRLPDVTTAITSIGIGSDNASGIPSTLEYEFQWL